ncbi:hypothetical protein WA158_000918 [Blastocystis sp. Blastoise]
MSKKTSEIFWENTTEDAYASLYCPYVVGLADGDLPNGAFLEYLHQDYFYLTIYEKAYRKAAQIYRDMGNEEMAIKFDDWAKTAIYERGIHEKRAADRGVTLDNIVPLKATVDYTNLLTEAYTSRPLCDIVSAINPCGKLYWFVAYFMVHAYEGCSKHNYTEWIDTYASDWMTELVEVLDRMLDELPCEDIDSLYHYYSEAMRLEYEFFNQQSGVSPLWTTQVLQNIFIHKNAFFNYTLNKEAMNSYKEKIEDLLKSKGVEEGKPIEESVFQEIMKSIQTIPNPYTLTTEEYKGISRFLSIGKEYALHIQDGRQEEQDKSLKDRIYISGPSIPDIFAGIESGSEFLLWVRPSVEDQKIMKQLGYTVISLYRLVGGKTPKEFAKKTIYVVENWYEIGFTFIGGHYYSKQSYPSVPSVCIVAGSDSGGGAGIQVDLKSCTAIGVFSTNVIVALTAQNTQGVKDIYVPPMSFIEEEFDCVLSDIGTDVMKTGMLGTKDVIDVVCNMIDKYHVTKVVVDPVMIATSGDSLLKEDAVDSLKKNLLPRAYLITPNKPEAEFLLGHPISHDIEEMKKAAKELSSFGSKCVLIKGGHNNELLEAIDVLYISSEDQYYTYSSPYIYTRNTHGTGCTLASSISAYFALGNTIQKSVELAKQYISNCLKESRYLHIGKGRQGPVNHCWQTRQWK